MLPGFILLDLSDTLSAQLEYLPLSHISFKNVMLFSFLLAPSSLTHFHSASHILIVSCLGKQIPLQEESEESAFLKIFYFRYRMIMGFQVCLLIIKVTQADATLNQTILQTARVWIIYQALSQHSPKCLLSV